MAGFDGTVPSSPFEKGGRGDLQGVAMGRRSLLVDHLEPMGPTARDRIGLKSPGTWSVVHAEQEKGAAFHSGGATTIQSVPSWERKIPPTPLCESGAQETLVHMTHSIRGRASILNA